MPKKLVKYRHAAYVAQSGRCYYCKMPMWEHDVEAFSKEHQISVARARFLKSTAEHLKARQDGGKDTKQNIVAACYFCNRGRHRIKQAPKPEAFLTYVSNRLATGKWTASWLRCS